MDPGSVAVDGEGVETERSRFERGAMASCGLATDGAGGEEEEGGDGGEDGEDGVGCPAREAWGGGKGSGEGAELKHGGHDLEN